MALDVLPSAYAVGPIVLTLGAMTLSGPRGEVRLADRRFRLMECLMRRPGMLVSCATLIAAMYDDDEADSAEKQLIQQIGILRGLVVGLGAEGTVTIRNEPKVGYAIDVRRNIVRVNLEGM